VNVNDAANVWAAENFAAYKKWSSDYETLRREWRLSENRHNVLLAETRSQLSGAKELHFGLLQEHISSGTNITGGRWSFTAWHVSDSYMVAKFMSYFYYITATTGENMIMFPFFRSEELLLNRIEAEIHLDRFGDAVNDLNVYYRQRSGNSSEPSSLYDEVAFVLDSAKIMNYWKTSLGNNFLREQKAFGADTWSDYKVALMLTLLDTRRVEYLDEGMRWFDVLRYKIPVNHRDVDGRQLRLSSDDPRRLWQLPEAAIHLGLEKNPR
jgi:hypothetical protein